MSDDREAVSEQETVRSRLLSPGEDRDAAYLQHPLIRNKQILATPALEEAYNILKNVISSPEFGLCFYCSPRNGKTTALDAIEELLSIEFPNVPVFRASASKHAASTEKSQWQGILRDVKHAVAHTALNQRDDLIDLMIASALAAQSDVVILMVDEAQNWEPEHWEYLKGATNSVTLRSTTKVRVITLSFGQLQLIDLRAKILDHHDMAARFFADFREFPGLQNVDALIKIFEQLDNLEQTEWPEGGGICYSEFFMPIAYAAGWRLRVEMPKLWQAFIRTNVTFKYVKMAAVFHSVKLFFIQNRTKDSAGFEGSLNLWDEAVKKSVFNILHQ